MSFIKKRFYYEADEANYIKLQSLSKKNTIQPKDFQKIINGLIYTAYKQSKR
jgi:hypothetical protein